MQEYDTVTEKGHAHKIDAGRGTDTGTEKWHVHRQRDIDRKTHTHTHTHRYRHRGRKISRIQAHARTCNNTEKEQSRRDTAEKG